MNRIYLAALARVLLSKIYFKETKTQDLPSKLREKCFTEGKNKSATKVGLPTIYNHFFSSLSSCFLCCLLYSLFILFVFVLFDGLFVVFFFFFQKYFVLL